MKGFWKLTLMEAKLFLREPAAAFFTLVFPLMMLFLFGSIFGNEPNPSYEGLGPVDVLVPGYTAMIIATSGLFTLPVVIALYRERRILRRLKATPLPPLAILGAQLVVILLMTLLGMALQVVAGKLVYGLRFNGNPLEVMAAFLLSSLSFFAFGFVLASVSPTARSAQTVAMVLFYPMIFLSGATLPREIFPENVLQLAQVLPLSHVVTLLQGLWMGKPWGNYWAEVGLLSALSIVFVVVSVRTFRWEPKN